MANKPTNQRLYSKVKTEAKSKFKVWPSAYASGWLVREYKRRGGKYKKSKMRFSPRRSRRPSRRKSRRPSRRKSPRRSRRPSRRKSGLSRWFAEEWIDVCKLPRIVPCGRKSARRSNRSYPYCRPRYKVTSSTPHIAGSLTKSEIRKRCSKKKRNPSKRVMPRSRRGG